MTALSTTHLLLPSIPQNDETVIAMWLHGSCANTRRAYQADADRLLAFTGAPIRATTLQHLQRFSDSLTNSAASKRRTLCAIKSLLAFAFELGYVQFDVGRALKVSNKKIGVRPQRILTEAQVQAILARATDRNLLILKLLYVTGVRREELASLRWGDCTPRGEAGQITVTGKGDKTRSVLLTESVWRELNARRGQDDQSVFGITASAIFRVFKAAALAAGIPQASPHFFRHAAATHAIANGAPLSQVKDDLGHSSISVTSQYLHALPNASVGHYLKIG